jgi:hypothetical protein
MTFAAISALSLPGAETGLWYFFHVNIDDLLNYNVWLEALSQSAWYPESWWDPFGQFTIGTCLLQWILVILAGLAFNDKISNIKSLK